MPDHEITAFTKGVQNLLSPELIPSDAASDSSNWYTQDGRIKLIPGRLRIGTEGAVGSIQGEIWGYKVDGSKVHWRKNGSTIQYFDGTSWQTTVSGLTATADYTFSNYSSLAGTFTFATGIDGIFKMHNANPGSYLALYNSSINFKGYSFIDRGRMILWSRPEDKTGLYGSKIDPQNSTVYTTVTEEAFGSGDGTTKIFSGTLATHSSGTNAFGISPFGQIAATKTVTAITKNTLTEIAATSHGLTVGDKFYIHSVSGMTQINGLIATVTSIVDANHFFSDIDSSNFTAYTSGGTLYKVEQFTDNYLGGFTSNLGGTGTINYLSGAFSLTFNTAPVSASNNILANYQYENSNNGGVTDFRHSGTRIAGEGFVFPQDEGGDAIQRVLIGQDGSYYSMKSQSAYQLALDPTDLNATNLVYRRNMGVPFLRAAVSMQKGIVFINTSNPEKPELTILQRNPVGGDIEPLVLFPAFKFANYTYDDCAIETYERYITIACKSLNATSNDTVLLCDLTDGTVDILGFNVRTFAADSGFLYVGSSVTQTVYQLFSGFDDDGLSINNYWISKDELLAPRTRNLKVLSASQGLKKVRYLRIRGRIDPNQYYEVYVSYDDAGFQLVGTVRGSGTYVDSSEPQEIGANIVGGGQIGGDVLTTIFPYFVQLKLKSPKFRKRMVKFVAKGIGYLDIEAMADHQILGFENRIPKRFRSDQNVSLDGLSTDQANPSY
jgi:hypothetical protein